MLEYAADYPTPPRVEPCARHLLVTFNGVVIAETRRGWRVLETNHPPVYYIPPQDVRMEHLSRTPRATLCEWKGQAAYYTVTVGERTAENAAWAYLEPTPEFEAIRSCVAFYPAKMDACTVDGEQVLPQGGGYYGGWITRDVRGPFKGD